jgi:hypothetical protein
MARNNLVEEWKSLIEGKNGELRSLDRPFKDERGDRRAGWNAKRDEALAVMMENFRNNPGDSLNEDTTTSVISNGQAMTLPLIRKTMGQLIAFDLALVSPINKPTAQVFIRSYKTGSARGNIAAATSLNQTFARHYSSEYVEEEAAGTGNGATKIFSGSLLQLPVRPYNSTTGVSVVITDGTEVFTDDGSGLLVGDDGGTGTINYSTGAFRVTFNTAPTNGDAIVASYYQNMEGSSAVGETTLAFEAVTMTAQTRRLRASLTFEAMDEIRSHTGADAEQEIVDEMTIQIATELDRQIIDAQLSAASTTDTLAYSATAVTELDNILNILKKLDQISARVRQRTRGFTPNYIVVGPEIIALIDQLSGHENYRATLKREGAGMADGVEPVASKNPQIKRWGTYNNKYVVYEDLFMDEGSSTKRILLGYRGSTWEEAGTIFAPYMPIRVVTQVDPVTMTKKFGVITRNALKVHRPEFYGKLSITGLSTLA